MATLQDMTTMTHDQLIAEITRMKDKANKQASARVRLKVSEKGAISVYGLGRFPVTLYRSQFETLIGMVKSGEVEEFIQDNSAALKSKDD